MTRPGLAGLALVSTLAAGCGAPATVVGSPFAVRGGVESGPSSGSWGDGSSGPTGMHVGCIHGRRLAVLITVRNRTTHTIELHGGSGTQRFPDLIRRVAVQVRLAPPPPKGDLMLVGLRSWSGRAGAAVSIPAGRSAWVQSNFLMLDCSSLRAGHALTINRSTTLVYRYDGRKGTEEASVASARIILTRGPLHPTVPINRTG